MIDLYTWHTPNGRKISILLEEMNISYKIVGEDLPVQNFAFLLEGTR